jgi:hypothetical protein
MRKLKKPLEELVVLPGFLLAPTRRQGGAKAREMWTSLRFAAAAVFVL